MSDITKFNELWDDFVNILRGKMKRTAAKQRLTLPLAKLILAETALIWESEYETAGRWLAAYRREQPERGNLLRQILVEDMQFAEVSTPAPLPSWTAYAVAGAGAVAGLAVARYALAARPWVQALSALAPIIILYPAMRQLQNKQNDRATRAAIDAWLSQLEKYHNSAETVLNG